MSVPGQAKRDMVAEAELQAIRQMADALDGIRFAMLDLLEETKKMTLLLSRLDRVLAHEEQLRAEETERRARTEGAWQSWQGTSVEEIARQKEEEIARQKARTEE
jgi:hypothetical protein